MSDLGFIIPLNLDDYLPFVGKPQGDRTNWCTAQTFWTNENLRLSGSSLGPTSAQVGDTVSIQVGVQGVLGSGGFTEEGQIKHVQAWVCYPNTVPGLAGPIVPSMTTGPTPAKDLTGSPQIIFGSSQAADYQNASSPSFVQFTLDNTWSPQAGDIIPPNTQAHCCIIATCQGVANVSDGGGVDVGLFIPGNNLSPINICSDPHEGQTNISILPIGGGHHRRFGDFAFFCGSGGHKERAQVAVEVRSVEQANGVDPAVLRVLQAGPWRDLPLRPAKSQPLGFGLRKNPHKMTGWLETIIREAEDFIEDLIEAVEGRSGDARRGRRLKLTLPPGGLQSLLLEMELDANDPVGTVHALEVVQTGPSDRRGGIRIGAVVVP